MSKIRAATQIKAGTFTRDLLDAALTAEVNKFGTDILDLYAVKADLTYVDQQIADLINGSPEALDTLKELSDALNNEADFGANVMNKFASHALRLDAIEGDVDVIKALDLVRGEVPVGVTDGANLVFTLARQPRAGSVMVYKNGVADFSPDITVDEVAKTVTFTIAPEAGDKVHVCYEAVRVAG